MKKITLSSVVALFTATVLTGFGVVVFIHANLGSDTITVFIDGLRNRCSLTLGEASRIYNISALLLALAFSRKDIGWTSVVYALSTGFVMDFFDPLLPMQFIQSTLFIRILAVLFGQLCIILSFALLIRFGRGMDQLDAIAYGLCRMLPFPFSAVRTAMDMLLLVSGFLMGGVAGIGSVIAMATTGIGIDRLLHTSWFTKQEEIGEQYEKST